MKKIATIFCLFVSLYSFSQNEMPNVNLKSLEGNTINIQDAVNKDHVVIVSIWATWCVPCLKELDAIADLYDEWQDETNVELIAVSIDDGRTAKRVKPLVNGKGWDYTVLLDSNNDLKRALSVTAPPLTLVIKDNKVVYRHSGYSAGAEDELYEKVKEYSK